MSHNIRMFSIQEMLFIMVNSAAAILAQVTARQQSGIIVYREIIFKLLHSVCIWIIIYDLRRQRAHYYVIVMIKIHI